MVISNLRFTKWKKLNRNIFYTLFTYMYNISSVDTNYLHYTFKADFELAYCSLCKYLNRDLVKILARLPAWWRVEESNRRLITGLQHGWICKWHVASVAEKRVDLVEMFALICQFAFPRARASAETAMLCWHFLESDRIQRSWFA